MTMGMFRTSGRMPSIRRRTSLALRRLRPAPATLSIGSFGAISRLDTRKHGLLKFLLYCDPWKFARGTTTKDVLLDRDPEAP